MKKLFITILLVGSAQVIYFFYPVFVIQISKNELINLAVECEKSKGDMESIDVIGKNESIETRVNLFMNAKANEFNCFDLELLENKLLAKRVSIEKINYLKLKSIAKDPKLIENVNSNN